MSGLDRFKLEAISNQFFGFFDKRMGESIPIPNLRFWAIHDVDIICFSSKKNFQHFVSVTNDSVDSPGFMPVDLC
jgi:hypothetical protein